MKRPIPQTMLIVGVALLAGCVGKMTNISDYYYVREISGKYSKIFVKSARGEFEYLGVVGDAGWAEKLPFGHSGLRANGLVVSENGRSIVWAEGKGIASKGLYHHEYGVGVDTLLHEGEYVIAATRYPRPLPPDVLVIRRYAEELGNSHDDQIDAVSADGKIFPVLLLGGSELHQAAWEGDAQSISDLSSESNTGIDALSYWGMTPAEVAIVSGREAATLQLLRLGASLKQEEESLIYLASAYHRSRLVDELLKRNASYDHIREDGNTAFHAIMVAFLGSIYPSTFPSLGATIPTIGIYLKHGADINMRNGEGRTLLQVMCLHASKFRLYGVGGPGPVAEYLVAMGTDVNAVDYEGNTALHGAVTLVVAERDKEVWKRDKLSLLAVIGPRMKNIDVQNNQGITPLHRAVQMVNVRTAEYLISLGADASGKFVHRGFGPKSKGKVFRKELIGSKRGIGGMSIGRSFARADTKFKPYFRDTVG